MNETQDPKYATGPIINRATGRAIPLFEPTITFRAQDPWVREHVIKPYAAKAAESGATSIHDAMIERFQAFDRFATEHPELMKDRPDTSTTQCRAMSEQAGMVAIARPYTYVLSGPNVLQFVKPEADRLLPGTTTEEALDVLIDRVSTQDAMSPCSENKDILLHLAAARSAQVRRMARVEPTLSVDLAPGVIEQFGILMSPCNSANLEAFGYDADRRVLALRFRGGRVYHYADVPQDVYGGLVQAESKGGYAARFITGGQFEGVRQDEAAAA